MLRTLLFLFLIAVFGTAGDVSLSHGMKKIGEVRRFTPGALLGVAWRAARVPWLWLGVTMLTCAFFSFLSLLSWQPVSFVLPASALGFVVGAFAARFVLGENVDPTRWAGVVIVCIGMGVLWLGQDDLAIDRAAIFLGVRSFLMIFALAPLAFYVVSIFSARRFFAKQRAINVGRVDSGSAAEFAPPVSILKPIYGQDREAYENYASFCRLDYPEYEVLFAVDRPSDPAVPVIEKVIADFPNVSVRLFIGADLIGANNKVCKLARLEREARYDWFAITDGDVRVEPDYLRVAIAPFRDPSVGAVTALYRGQVDGQLGSRMECLGASVEFSAGVLVAQELEGLKFAMGSTMATSRARLDEIGGFATLADHHSDDYEFGNRIAKNGHRVELMSKPVGMIYPGMTLGEYLRHELRWQIGIRHVRPWSHAGLIFTHALPFSLIAAAVAPSARIGAAFLLSYLALRMVMGWTIAVRGLDDPVARKNLWLLPLRDLLAFAAWCASFVSDTIHWSGAKFTLEQGRMVPLAPPPNRA
jgi:ceramide glucosyltransferase